MVVKDVASGTHGRALMAAFLTWLMFVPAPVRAGLLFYYRKTLMASSKPTGATGRSSRDDQG
jgi:hypothetical protein